jgi:Xaa-Pro aminopeptidase
MPKVQAKLITDKSNITYLSNFTGSSGFMLLTRSRKYLFTDFRYIERAKNSIKKGIEIVDTTRMWRNKKDLSTNWQKILNKHKIKNLGVEESNLTVSKYKFYKRISGKVKLSDISGSIEETREIKTAEEIKLMKKSQQINEKVFKEINKIVHEHLKSRSRKAIQEIDLAWKIKELGNEFGAEDVSFDPIVGFGKNSSIVHHDPGKTKLKKGEIILVDMGMKYQGYCSDMTRMIFTGKPSKKIIEVYNIVLSAQLEAIKHIKAGTTGFKADALARDIINKAGYGEFYGHAGGHGVGLDIHETPSLSQNFKGKLKANSIITIEPGIYLPGKFGIRIEDMLLVQKNGNKNLTKIPKQ